MENGSIKVRSTGFSGLHPESQMKSEGISPLVAVIITVYNKEKYLRDSIESVLRQRTDFPFVVLLSEDCGTDNCREICREYAETYTPSRTPSHKNPIVIDISPDRNLGLVANCYHCIEHALSLGVEFISQLDCDDVMADPYFLQGQIDALRRMGDCQAVYSDFFLIGENVPLTEAYKIAHSFNAHKKAGICSSAHHRDCCENEYLVMSDAAAVSHLDSYGLLTSNNPMVAGAVTYRAENLGDFMKFYMNDEEYVKSLKTQDLPLWLFLSLYGNFAYRNRKCIGYRDLETSISRSPDVLKMEAFQRASMEVRLDFLKLFENKEFTDRLSEKGIDLPSFAVRCSADACGATYGSHTTSERKRKNAQGFSQSTEVNRLKRKITTLYCRKMLRHYAKLSPERYPQFALNTLKKSPGLLISSDFLRSLGVFAKSCLMINLSDKSQKSNRS